MLPPEERAGSSPETGWGRGEGVHFLFQNIFRSINSFPYKYNFLNWEKTNYFSSVSRLLFLKLFFKKIESFLTTVLSHIPEQNEDFSSITKAFPNHLP